MYKYYPELRAQIIIHNFSTQIKWNQPAKNQKAS